LLFRELLPCWPDWTLQCNVAPADLVEDKRINVCRSFGIGVSRMRPGEVLGDHPPAHTKEVDNLPDQTDTNSCSHRKGEEKGGISRRSTLGLID
jgi:hypothetical protein